MRKRWNLEAYANQESTKHVIHSDTKERKKKRKVQKKTKFAHSTKKNIPSEECQKLDQTC
jgi:hypothetical protein